jgi:hypothetical protein
MGDPLLKKDYVNIPVSIEKGVRDFFDQHADTLGISRNAALCLALKIGGPVLGEYVKSMRAMVKQSCVAIAEGAERAGDLVCLPASTCPAKPVLDDFAQLLRELGYSSGNSENLGPPATRATCPINAGHEQRKRKSGRH